MKATARSYLWWPRLDQEIEELVKGCTQCQSVRNAPEVAPLHPWLWPTKPWKRVHINFAGPLRGHSYFILVDAHSKWPEVIDMNSNTTSAATIRELRKIFARFGLPEQLVSDNGPQFVSSEFTQFLKNNGVKHIKSAPYHPSTNGIAERFVQSFKRAMLTNESLPMEQRLANFLLRYRTTVHATTNVTPCMLLMNRQLRTRLDLLRPNTEVQVTNKQADQKVTHDQHSRSREFMVGQRVMVRNLRPGPSWIPGTIVERNGPLSYVVQVKGEQVWKRHVEHLQEVGDTPVEEPTRDRDDTNQPPVDESDSFPVTPDTVGDTATQPSDAQLDSPELSSSQTATSPVTNQPTEVPHRYPRRIHRPPKRYRT